MSESTPDTTQVLRIAAFADGDRGGNPAGVLIAAAHPGATQMQAIAAAVGFSETAFASPVEGGWRLRAEFSPMRGSSIRVSGLARVMGQAPAHS